MQNFLSYILPLFFQTAQTAHLDTPGLPKLWVFALEHPTPPSRAVVFMGGRGSALIGYADTLLDFYEKGFDVYGVDLQGFGFSERVAKNSHMSHALDFQSYAQDLDRLLQWKQNRRRHTSQVLVTGSMGATVAVLHQGVNSNATWQAAVFLAPMFGLAPVGYPMGAVRVASGVMRWLGAKEVYAPGQRDYAPGSPFCSQHLTTSAHRCALREALYERYPTIKNGGLSWGWLHGAFRAMEKAQGLAPQWSVPTLLLLAGADNRVDNHASHSFCKRAPRCSLLNIPGAYHDLLNGPPDVRDVVMKSIYSHMR